MCEISYEKKLLNYLKKHNIDKVNIFLLENRFLKVEIKGKLTVSFDLDQCNDKAFGCKISTSIPVPENSDTHREFVTISRYIHRHEKDIRKMFKTTECISNIYPTFKDELLDEFRKYGFHKVSLNLWNDNSLYANIKGLPTIVFNMNQPKDEKYYVNIKDKEEVPSATMHILIEISKFLYKHEEEIRELFKTTKSVSNTF